MTRIPAFALFALGLVPITAAAAASLTVTRTATVAGDPLALVKPRMLPGVSLDVALSVTNPIDNLLTPVRLVTISDTVSAGTAMRVTDLVQPGRGPVEFMDGGLLGLGLTSSGLGYRFGSLRDPADGLEFSDGTTWSYQPVADDAGYDPKVRAIRVTLTGTHAAGGSFRLRYRATVQ